MLFYPKYSKKWLIYMVFFYLPDFLAPFWHRTPCSKYFVINTYYFLCHFLIAPIIFYCYNQNMGATITVGG